MQPPDAAPVGPATWAGFAAMCLGKFRAVLDVQIVAASLPNIQTALKIPPDQMSWVQTAYLIAEVIAIPLTGLLTRIATMRWLFVGAVALFTLASLGCAASGSFGVFVGWRVVQGLAGVALIPAVFAAVFLLFSTAPSGGCHHRCRRNGRAGPNGWPDHRWLNPRHLLVALVVSDQRRPRHCRHRCCGIGLAARYGAVIAGEFG